MNTVRWGLVSTAHINDKVIPALRTAARSQLIAVASRDKDKSIDYAQKWEIPLAFGSYQEMLDSDQVDAVYISLPNHLHAEWTVRALQAGKHVLCEKPFALSLDEVDQMIAASKETKRCLAEAFMYLHHPQMALVKEWVNSGRLGEISLVRGVFNYSIEKEDNVRLEPAYGGGCMWDVGVYPMSFAQFVYGGPPDSVSAWQWIGDSGVDEGFAAQMCFRSGRLAQISASFHSPLYTMAEVIGTEGRLLLDRPFSMLDRPPQMWFYRSQEEVVQVPVPEAPNYLGEVEDMVHAILDGAPLRISLAETRNHVKTALALYESARKATSITL